MLARGAKAKEQSASCYRICFGCARAHGMCVCALWRRMQYKTQSTLGTVMVFMVISVTPNKDIKLSHSVSLLPLHYYLLSAIDLSSLRARTARRHTDARLCRREKQEQKRFQPHLHPLLATLENKHLAAVTTNSK